MGQLRTSTSETLTLYLFVHIKMHDFVLKMLILYCPQKVGDIMT